jgi:hypothetical protein
VSTGANTPEKAIISSPLFGFTPGNTSKVTETGKRAVRARGTWVVTPLPVYSR